MSAALEALADSGADHIPAIGLAKKQEEVFLPRRTKSVLLPRDSEGLYLLQRIRDEAHRFAITYHRQLRGKAGLASPLEQIAGVGPRRRQALLRRFGSIEAVQQASVDQLAEVAGMNRQVAERIKECL